MLPMIGIHRRGRAGMRRRHDRAVGHTEMAGNALSSAVKTASLNRASYVLDSGFGFVEGDSGRGGARIHVDANHARQSAEMLLDGKEVEEGDQMVDLERCRPHVVLAPRPPRRRDQCGIKRGTSAA